MALRNTVSDYLIHRLKELGINHAFGVPGDFALDLLDKFVNGNASGEKIEFVNTCNELNGGYAADGYARIKGAGCLVTTYGVGELSAINSIGGCYAERVPVVAITGAPTLECMKRNVPYHHTLGDYKKMLHIFEQVTVASCYLEDAQTAPAEIDRVLTAMMYHKRPVYIAVPQDMVNAECPRPQGKLSVTLEKSDETSLNKAISEVVQLVQKSQHPIIIGDFEIKRFGLQHKFKELVEKSRIPFAVTALGKGLLNESHPGFLGVYAGAASLPNVKNFVENSDCILIFGNLPSDFNTGKFTEKIPAKKAIIVNLHQISICGKVIEGVTLIDVITQLAKSIPEKTEQSRDFVQACETFPYCASKQCGDVKPHDKLTSNHFFHRISTVLPENSIIVAETGNSGFAALDMKFPSGTIFIAQFFYSSIGYSVGAALGASIAAPNRKVFLFIGDGSFQVTAQDISTMIRFRCDVTVFLMNNDGYTTERLIKDGPFNDLLLWNYAKFPAVFGQKEGWCLETVGQLEDCLQHCALRSNFCFVEWKVPRLDLPYVVQRIHDGEKDSSIEKKRARLDAFNVSTLREKLPQRG